MGFFSNLFKKKNVVKVEIIDHEDGLDEEDKLDNLVIGDMEEGFEGMICADIYNEYNSANTTFLIYYDDNSTKMITVNDDSRDFNYYMNFVE